MPEEDEKTFECGRCGDEVTVDDAVMLTRTNNKQMWKYLCPDCLGAIGVPQGYELERDLSHLE